MKTIMLVEDNEDNRYLVQALLSDDYRLTVYESGIDALEGLRRSRPDLVLLDVSLPGMDGVQVVREVRTDPALASVPVIALTAHAMLGDRERFLAEGFDGYVAKPIVNEEELLGEVERLLCFQPSGQEPEHG